MTEHRIPGRYGVLVLAGLMLLATPLEAETPKQRFAFTIDGDWPIQEVRGDSAWTYGMNGFFHIGLDTKTAKTEAGKKRRVILDINKMGEKRPKVGKYSISTSNMSHYSATLELQGDEKRTARSGSGELHIEKVTPVYTTGRFTFKSTPTTDGPDITVAGDFVAKVRPKRRSKQ